MLLLGLLLVLLSQGRPRLQTFRDLVPRGVQGRLRLRGEIDLFAGQSENLGRCGILEARKKVARCTHNGREQGDGGAMQHVVQRFWSRGGWQQLAVLVTVLALSSCSGASTVSTPPSIAIRTPAGWVA